MTFISTRFYDSGSIDQTKLTYVVIGARFDEKWIFVRHRDRVTWEMPAGHIEKDESADQAAVRELFEETGAVDSALVHICDYSVRIDQNTNYGRLYGAVINKLDPRLEYETEERQFSNELPAELTYPEVQTLLFSRAKQHFQL